jgi:collagenase-like PrtC family protease
MALDEMKTRDISLALGPLLFHWPVEKIWDFYARVADEAPVDTVYLGEVVCSKRLPHYCDALPALAERLRRGGKTVILSSLALVTLVRERKACAELMQNDVFEVEVNDLTALAFLARGLPFRVGPFVNVYNESTLAFLASQGASALCLPPELGIGSVETLASAARELQVGCEVWAFGRIPLAISGRCYHARLAGVTKDACQFVCSRDSDGREVDTLGGKPILAINGVQTLSHTFCNVVEDVERLATAGVTGLRLSPHSCDMIVVSGIFRDRLDGRLDKGAAWEKMALACGPADFSNGFMFGNSGAELVRLH